MDNGRSVTASIVSHGQGELVDYLIGDLIRSCASRVARLVVTLNVPEREPRALAHAPFEIIVLRNAAPLGFGANHNQAFRHCETPWFAILNPDLRADADFIGVLIAAAHPDDALLSPLILDAEGRKADAVRPLVTPWQMMRRALGERRRATTEAADWLAGMCLLARADAFRTVGGFDLRYFMYCEDVDLSLRMQIAGWRLAVVEDARVVHSARRASRQSARHFRWHVASLLHLWMSRTYWRYQRCRAALQRVRGLVP
jgi:hypothetical protein